MYAIWLLFEKNDEKYIAKIISEISKQYESPIFIPHITAYGLIDVKFEIIDKVILDSIKNTKSFNIEKNSISFSGDFWKTLFIDFNSNSSMLKINKNLVKHLSSFTRYEFKPHTSLIYKEMNQEEKQKLVNKIDIKNNFKITRIGILEFSESIKEWKIIQEYSLD